MTDSSINQEERRSISFVEQDRTQQPQSGWYTIQGVKLPAAPQTKGVFIYNGKKILIY